MMTQLWKALLFLFMAGSPEALEFPQFLRGGDNGRDLMSVSTLSQPAIATLVTRLTDLSELCYTLYTLIYADKDLTAPVIVFYDKNSYNLQRGQMNTLETCTDRSLIFSEVDFSVFAAGFTPEVGRDYTYEQSQRFYASGMWNEPALAPYDVILRISDDSCLTHNNTLLPYLYDDHVYQGHAVPHAYEIARKFSTSLYETAFAHISNKGRSPLFKNLWANVVQTHTDLNTVPLLNSDFEVVRKSFIQRSDVANWLYAITDLPPYGFYNYRWGTNAERYITLAIFAQESEISLAPVPGFVEKDFIGGKMFERICRPHEESS